jgi:hypothetical protein
LIPGASISSEISIRKLALLTLDDKGRLAESESEGDRAGESVHLTTHAPS